MGSEQDAIKKHKIFLTLLIMGIIMVVFGATTIIILGFAINILIPIAVILWIGIFLTFDSSIYFLTKKSIILSFAKVIKRKTINYKGISFIIFLIFIPLSYTFYYFIPFIYNIAPLSTFEYSWLFIMNIFSYGGMLLNILFHEKKDLFIASFTLTIIASTTTSLISIFRITHFIILSGQFSTFLSGLTITLLFINLTPIFPHKNLLGDPLKNRLLALLVTLSGINLAMKLGEYFIFNYIYIIANPLSVPALILNIVFYEFSIMTGLMIFVFYYRRTETLSISF